MHVTLTALISFYIHFFLFGWSVKVSCLDESKMFSQNITIKNMVEFGTSLDLPHGALNCTATDYTAPMSPSSAEVDFSIAIHTLQEKGNLSIVKETPSILELHTILKDRTTDHSDFVFYADRLMRLVVERALNRLPYTDLQIETPTRCKYKGIAFARGNCGMSLCRSGEAMEHALRQCCRSIRICKMLIGSIAGEEHRVLYARLTPDIAQRRVLVLYPVISAGITTIKALHALKDSGVDEKNIYLISLFITPHALLHITEKFPKLTVITSDVTTGVPHSFAMKYFGTD